MSEFSPTFDVSKWLQEHREIALKLLEPLRPRERDIIKMRSGIGDGYTYTLEEVGRRFKVTRERVRQIEARAYRSLERWGLTQIEEPITHAAEEWGYNRRQPEIDALKAIAEAERFVACLHCGKAIQYPGDIAPENLIKDMMAHETSCQENPLVKERDALRAELEKAKAERDGMKEAMQNVFVGRLGAIGPAVEQFLESVLKSCEGKEATCNP